MLRMGVPSYAGSAPPPPRGGTKDKEDFMRKRFLSLLCVLALCLGLLPVTALAAGEDKPGTLWVGQTQITADGYWKTNPDGTLTTEGANKDNYNVYYDGNGTLTLNNAKIQGRGYSGNPQPEDYGIYAAPTGNQSVSLTINLMGSNTVSGYCGICVETTTADNASLVIQPAENDPQGSLEAIGNKYNGITISSGSGNASLTINNAPVVAISKSPAPNSYHGVCIKTGNATAPALSLLVNGGSLTARGESGYGIYFYMRDSTTDPSTSLTVQNNALVKATPSIVTSNNLSKPDTTAGSESGGIVFDGKNGTVYGDVELQDDLTINEGETLTIGKDASLTVPENVELTNSGTIINNGTLTGEVGGSGTVTPKITTDSLPNGTVGESYTATLEATGNNITWSASGLPDGLTLNSDGTITGIPSAEGTPTVTVTATNASGSDSKEYTLNIKSATVLVTRVTLDKTTLELFTGNTATLTATVQPDSATNKNVTWSSDRSDVATVDNGVVTAVGEGEATITATAADGSGKFATCKVTVTQSTYSISADTKALDFGGVYTGYTQPAAKTVTITNDGNQSLTLTQPASTSSFAVGTLSKTALAAGEKATFTVQPKAGLAVGTYSENITISDSGHVTLSIPASFTVEQRDNTPYYGITVNAPANGTVTCYAKSAAKGAEVTLTVKPDVGYALDKLTVTDASGKTVDVTKVDEKTYTFVMPGRAVTVEAVFAPSTSGLPFTDVSAGDWFYEAVQFVYENGLMDGVAGNLFAPNATLNRAMAVTILYRLEGSPDLDGENLGYPFADVDGDAWYGDAVYWARCNGIVDGVENNHFDPTGSLTREQMATVLYRYAQYKGADVSASGDISGFADSANVSSWAVDAVKWAVGTGLVNGVEGNALAPQGTSTRAQTAAILARFCGSVI